METQITLPRDAEGREIPLDTKVLYDKDNKGHRVLNYIFSTTTGKWIADFETEIASELHATECFSLTPPDSWKRLLDDLDNAAEEASNNYVNAPCCAWFNSGNRGCADCPADESPNDSCNVQLVKNIAARIRSLRGEER